MISSRLRPSGGLNADPGFSEANPESRGTRRPKNPWKTCGTVPSQASGFSKHDHASLLLPAYGVTVGVIDAGAGFHGATGWGGMWAAGDVAPPANPPPTNPCAPFALLVGVAVPCVSAPPTPRTLSATARPLENPRYTKEGRLSSPRIR